MENVDEHNRVVYILYGYSGTLKSTISRRSKLPRLTTSNEDLKKLKKRLFPNQEFIMYSNEMLIHHMLRIKEFLSNTVGNVIINRSLTDYLFWNLNPDNLVMDDDEVLELENELFEDYEVKRILLHNASPRLKKMVEDSGKGSRDMTDYDRLSGIFTDRTSRRYGISPIIITDENLDYIVEGVNQLLV